MLEELINLFKEHKKIIILTFNTEESEKNSSQIIWLIKQYLYSNDIFTINNTTSITQFNNYLSIIEPEQYLISTRDTVDLYRLIDNYFFNYVFLYHYYNNPSKSFNTLKFHGKNTNYYNCINPKNLLYNSDLVMVVNNNMIDIIKTRYSNTHSIKIDNLFLQLRKMKINSIKNKISIANRCF